MALRLRLWALVLGLSSVVSADLPKNCNAPVLENGFFFPEKDMAHGTNLYYRCDKNFKPVAEDWWGTVTCDNGTWSPEPECVDASACFDPEIPNASYEKFKYKSHNDVLRIQCNHGYQVNNKRETVCRNGAWIPSPKCSVMESSCGKPPKLSNAVVVDWDYQDVFPNNTQVMYMCQSGFKMETHSTMTVCSNGQWREPYPSCRQKENNPALVPPVSTEVNTGSDNNYQPMITTTDQCGPAPKVKNGVPYKESDTSVRYECISLTWYKLKGNIIVRCFNGHWTPPPTCEDNFCKLNTSSYSHLETITDFIESGKDRWVNCPGPFSGWARAVCSNSELWLSKCCYMPTHYDGNCLYDKITP